MSGWRSRSLPGVVILAALALLVVVMMGDVLRTGSSRLPGRDAGNLYVWEMYTRSVLAAGRLPHWNPHHFAGTPHLADTLTTVFYPPAMLFRWVPPIPFLGWMAALHIWLGAAGVLFLSRVLGVRWLAATAAALAMMLGGSVGGWLYNSHLLLIYCTAWLPWCLGLAILSVRRQRLLPHPALVVVLALQFLAGYLQGSLYIAGTVAAYYVYSVFWPEPGSTGAVRSRSLGQLAILGVLTAGATAFQLAPTVRLVAEAARWTGLPYRDAAEGAWTLSDLATVFFPFHGVSQEPPHRYIGDRVVYVGWVLACLVPFALLDPARRRIVVFFGLIAAGAAMLALAYAFPFYRLHHAIFPGLRVPGRLLFIANVSLAVLGAIGLERFVQLASTRSWRAIALGGTITTSAVAASAAAVWAGGAVSDLPPAHLWPWLSVMAGVGLVIAGALAARGACRAALVVALALMAVDLNAYSGDHTETVPIESAAELRTWLGVPDGGRAITLCENRVGAGGLLINRQPGLDGLAGVYLDDYADWAYIAKMGDAPPDDGLFRRVGSEGLFPARRDLLDFANVTTIFSCEPLDVPSLTLVSHSASIYRYRNLSAWPRATWTCEAERLPRDVVVRKLLDFRYDHNRRLQRRHVVKVRWARGTSDEQRRKTEADHGLIDGTRREDDTWQYVYADPSTSNGIALIQDRSVEDTAGIDRGTGAVIEQPEAAGSATGPPELLIGTADCRDRGRVRVVSLDQPDGYVRVQVDAPVRGLVFFSEPYYSERQATVDGKPVRPLKTNLAFTSVPVPAGRHEIELRMVPRSFHWGLGISVLTLVVWAGMALRT